jgi:hypothetical protein
VCDGDKLIMVILIISHGTDLKSLTSISWSVDLPNATLQIHYDFNSFT